MDFDMYKQVSNILESAQGNPLDIYNTLYLEYVLKSEAPWEVFQLILEYPQDVGTADDTSPKSVTMDIAREINKTYLDYLHETVRLLVRQNLDTNVFYQTLYNAIVKSDLLPKGEDVQCVILKILAEEIPEIPYYPAENLLKMDNDEYQNALDRIFPYIRQAVHMLNRHFSSRTEEASQLHRIAAAIDNANDQVVYWSAIMTFLRRNEKTRTTT